MEKLQACIAARSEVRLLGLQAKLPQRGKLTSKQLPVRMMGQEYTSSTASYNQDIARFKGPVKESDLDAVRTALAIPAPSEPLKEGWEIPIVDLSQLRSSQFHLVRDQISRACQEWGFFYAINHDIPCEVFDDMWEAYNLIFKLPVQERGSFDCGPFIPPDILQKLNEKKEALKKYADSRDTIRLRDLNPDDNEGTVASTPQFFRRPACTFYKALRDVGFELLSAMSQSLGVEVDHIRRATGNNEAINSSLHFYSPNHDGSKTMGLNPHKDILTLTVLVQDETGGLQVLKEDKWIDVKPLPGSLVVNVGEAIQAITNGKFKSVLHRVVNHPEKTRSSISCFLIPTPDSVIEPIPHLVSEESPRLYPNGTWASFVHNHYALALKF
ncbi:hypothetical protein GOP47_0000657 [Adiantum capillus-veneris]|uniref:Fe2OG dioxygenase domain-containing protein n=1 Tax=Adiantum capillus-veneris TaxID=13818 RepID=A0A9D4ZQX2_ADICA|nr:hypothetical protein GOP47_0000657 [Adiantum capillus-veneris]